jgi:hypothetical protein
MRRKAFAWALTAICATVLAQSVAHLVLVLGADRIGTILDLDRSNGIPDLVSTLALALGAAGAVALSVGQRGAQRTAALAAAVLLAALTYADLLHDGAHPHRSSGPLVIWLVLATIALLAILAEGAGTRVRWTLGVAFVVLACSFLVIGLDRLNHRFERERGDPIKEYQIVVKEGLELLGWSLVALALWDEALRRRRLERAALEGELLEHRLHGDDVPLEAELGVRQSGRHTDQL